MNGILGKKIGMTQVYKDDGQAVPVTIVQAGPCVVVQRKTAEVDGYDAVQIGLVEGSRDADGKLVPKAPNKVNSPKRGHFKKAGVAPTLHVAEFPVDSESETKAGDEVDASIFAEDDYIDVVGTSKGKGFQGVMKRHGFGGGRASHGSSFHRAPGSIGQSAYPSRVFPNMKLPGQTGNKRITTKNLQVVKVDVDENLLFIKGSVPGARNSYVQIKPAKNG